MLATLPQMAACVQATCLPHSTSTKGRRRRGLQSLATQSSWQPSAGRRNSGGAPAASGEGDADMRSSQLPAAQEMHGSVMGTDSG